MMGWLGGVMCKVVARQKPLQMAENHLNLPTQRPIFYLHTLLISSSYSTSFTSLPTSPSSQANMCCIY